MLATFAPMKLRPALIELVVADMAATLAFYRRLGLDIPAAAEVDEAWQDLTAAGYRGYLQPWDAFWGKRYAVVLDPDGRPVDLFATLGSV